MTLSFDPVEEARRNWRKRGWPSVEAMTTATAITRSHQILLARINEALTPHGLTFARFEVLALLSFTRRGELPLGKIGQRLQVHAASVTNAIDRLERDGLVERRPHPHDGRATLASITDEGRDLVDVAAKELGAIDFGLAGREAVDHAAINDALRVIRRNAGDF